MATIYNRNDMEEKRVEQYFREIKEKIMFSNEFSSEIKLGKNRLNTVNPISRLKVKGETRDLLTFPFTRVSRKSLTTEKT